MQCAVSTPQPLALAAGRGQALLLPCGTAWVVVPGGSTAVARWVWWVGDKEPEEGRVRSVADLELAVSSSGVVGFRGATGASVFLQQRCCRYTRCAGVPGFADPAAAAVLLAGAGDQRRSVQDVQEVQFVAAVWMDGPARTAG